MTTEKMEPYMTAEKMMELADECDNWVRLSEGNTVDEHGARQLLSRASAALRSSAVGNLSRVEMDNIQLGRRLEAAEAHIAVLETRSQP